MQDVEKLLKGTVEELERLLNAKHVLADPIERDGATVIPLVSYGFGFGAGGGDDTKNGNGSGTGGGGGIKPRGAIIIDKDGARIESLKGVFGNAMETFAEGATRVMSAQSSQPKRNGKASSASKKPA